MAGATADPAQSIHSVQSNLAFEPESGEGDMSVVSAQFSSEKVVICTTPQNVAGRYVFTLRSSVPVDIAAVLYYTYEDVELLRLTPSAGPARGFTRVVLHGNNFRYSSELKCRFGSQIVDAKWNSPIEVVCSSPRSLQGTLKVQVRCQY